MQHSSTDKAQISFLLTDLEPQLDPRNALFRLSRARKAARRLKTIAGRVVRQLEAAGSQGKPGPALGGNGEENPELKVLRERENLFFARTGGLLHVQGQGAQKV